MKDACAQQQEDDQQDQKDREQETRDHGESRGDPGKSEQSEDQGRDGTNNRPVEHLFSSPCPAKDTSAAEQEDQEQDQEDRQ